MRDHAPLQYSGSDWAAYYSVSCGNLIIGALLFGIWIVSIINADAAGTLSCKIGFSPKFGSSWCDLSPPQDFAAGTTLDITLAAGGAKRVLVRLLPADQSPDEPVGIIGSPIDVPINNVVRIAMPTTVKTVKQISVHGGPAPWDIDLGSNNGNARITKVAVQ